MTTSHTRITFGMAILGSMVKVTSNRMHGVINTADMIRQVIAFRVYGSGSIQSAVMVGIRIHGFGCINSSVV